MKNLNIITTATGYFKPGIKGKIVGINERVIYVGPFGNEQKTIIPEFTLEFIDEKGKTWQKDFCQYGKDFVVDMSN